MQLEPNSPWARKKIGPSPPPPPPPPPPITILNYAFQKAYGVFNTESAGNTEHLWTKLAVKCDIKFFYAMDNFVIAYFSLLMIYAPINIFYADILIRSIVIHKMEVFLLQKFATYR